MEAVPGRGGGGLAEAAAGGVRGVRGSGVRSAAEPTRADLPAAPWPVTEDDVDYDACIDALLQARHETAACS